MAIGLGQMLISGLLGNEIGKNGGISGLLGGLTGDNKGRVTDEEMATHQMPDGTTMPGATHPEGGYNQAPQQQAQAPQQQSGGFMSGINNLSQSQLAKLGMGFNSMRMHPDANLAASFQKTIDSSSINKSRGTLVKVLKKQGKNNIAQLLEIGAISVQEASKYSLEKGNSKDIAAVINYLKKPNADPEVQAKLHDLAEIVEADNSMSDEAFKIAMQLTGLDADGKQYALGLSEIFTHQGKDLIDGVSKEGQHYQIQTDKATGEREKVWLDSYGETILGKQERIAKQEALVKDKALAQEMGTQYYVKAQSYRQQVDQFERIISAVEDGALSGIIAKEFPAFDDSTAILQGLVNELGISVINSATFGALSEREMEMAMRTNINLNLPPKELREMAMEQIRARRKLAQEYEKMAKRAKFEGDGTWSSFVKLSMEETDRHDAVVWSELTENEIERLALKGYGRNEYMDFSYEQRRAIFDARN